MRSPFPGIDPYLEPHWLDVHTKLVAYTADALNGTLPDDLIARTEERVAIESGNDEPTSIYSPDVRVLQAVGVPPYSNAPQRGGVAAAPYRLVAMIEPITERFVEIVDTNGERLVTVIEFLSPTNKRGPGRKAFVKKREQLLAGSVSVVEIDLIRAGNWRAMLKPHHCAPQKVSTYRAIVRLPWESEAAYLYPISLRDPLPTIRIPLRSNDEAVSLALQPLLDQAYLNGRYGRTLDYKKPLDPPLDETDAQWADDLLKSAGRR